MAASELVHTCRSLDYLVRARIPGLFQVAFCLFDVTNELRSPLCTVCVRRAVKIQAAEETLPDFDLGKKVRRCCHLHE